MCQLYTLYVDVLVCVHNQNGADDAECKAGSDSQLDVNGSRSAPHVHTEVTDLLTYSTCNCFDLYK